jgi:hypothetical protein
MRTRSLTIVTALTLATMPAIVRAQAPASPSTPQPPSATQGNDAGAAAQRCAPTTLPEPNSNRRPGNTTGQADSAPLSDKLAEGHGVLCPPAGVDPEIRAPTPDVGKMPVIPPPGSPGGDPSLQPK